MMELCMGLFTARLEWQTTSRLWKMPKLLEALLNLGERLLNERATMLNQQLSLDCHMMQRLFTGTLYIPRRVKKLNFYFLGKHLPQLSTCSNVKMLMKQFQLITRLNRVYHLQFSLRILEMFSRYSIYFYIEGK